MTGAALGRRIWLTGGSSLGEPSRVGGVLKRDRRDLSGPADRDKRRSEVTADERIHHGRRYGGRAQQREECRARVTYFLV
jgi:hypothetical protein